MSTPYIETGLSPQAADLHRALASLQEELDAIDTYHQRWDRTQDDSLKAVLAHNRDDELEHAMLLLEWLRRAMPALDAQMDKLLVTTGPITQATAGAGTARPPNTQGPNTQGLGLLQNTPPEEFQP